MENSFVFVMLFRTLPWYNHTGWLGAKYQVTYMLLDFCALKDLRGTMECIILHCGLVCSSWIISLYHQKTWWIQVCFSGNCDVFNTLCDVFCDFDYCQINFSTGIIKCCILLCLVYSYHLSFKLPWPVRSDFHLLSGISGPSFDSSFLSHLFFFPPSSVAISVLQFFCQWFIFLSFFPENSPTFVV